MRRVVPRKSLRQILRWTQWTLFAGAVTMLAYCGFVMVDAWIFQRGEQRELDQLLTSRQNGNSIHQTKFPISSKNGPPPVTGGVLGRIEIPRLGVSVVIIEGVGAKTLRRAVGHIPSTSLPGQPGNVAISGHRDTFFRPIRNIQQNDIITLTTLLGEFRYRVVSTRIVSPSDVTVLRSSRDEILTLVTCYPFYFVGSAPSRFIVRAKRVS